MKKAGSIDADEMRAEYDFSKGVRNPYAAKFKKGSNVVLIEPEIFKAFPSEEAVNSVFVTGGVAANSLLRERFRNLGGKLPPAFFPRLGLSTDNAAMIAAAAFPKFLAGQFAGWDANVDASLALNQ